MPRTVTIQRNGHGAADDPACFSRLHWALEPVAGARCAGTGGIRRLWLLLPRFLAAPPPPRQPG